MLCVAGVYEGMRVARIYIMKAVIPYPTALAIIPARKSGPMGDTSDPSRCFVDGLVTPSARVG